MQKLQKERFIIFDDLFDKLNLEYEQVTYCIVNDFRIYKYYGEYRFIPSDTFDKKRNEMPIIARIYSCNEIQSVKAKMCLEAYHGIQRYKTIRKEVQAIRFRTLEELEQGVYEPLNPIKGTIYVPNEEEAQMIVKNKHRRVKCNGLRRIFNV